MNLFMLQSHNLIQFAPGLQGGNSMEEGLENNIHSTFRRWSGDGNLICPRPDKYWNRNREQIPLRILRHQETHASHQRKLAPGSFPTIYGSIRQIDNSLNHFELALSPTPAKEPAVKLKDSVVPLPLAVKTLS
ncbi:uncharacterized protein Dyak_GE29055 [Drosophila yakuba]|uniref:Uncharacterized protein n=1 Tax=Drosophila yakuba TaxID=7245 RepID=A0A0R1DYS6_DROYA|nr:uncharacterized protein Dyak_GE29055 [Drosophila yakuba]